MAMEYTKSKGIPHSTMEEEWLVHKRQNEWWYATGYGVDKDGVLYSYQFTLIKAMVGIFPYFQLQCAVTNTATHDHRIVFRGVGKKEMEVSSKVAAVGNEARIEKVGKNFHVVMREDNFAADLTLRPAKRPVWHCDNGILQMRVPKKKEKTYYYSWTNCPCEGTLTFDSKEVKIKGKGWIDKQGGTYSLLKPYTHWEWFSPRFFDGEEFMLFSFPEEKGVHDSGYVDGTYIREDGSYCRLNNYSLEPLEFVNVDGMKFACKWKLVCPGVKEGEYLITPLIDGQLNLCYYELIARVENMKGDTVGYSFVELLAGARNKEAIQKTPKAGEKVGN